MSRFLTYSIKLIRFLGIIYLIYYLIIFISLYTSSDTSLFNERAVGPYAWAYWYMIIRPFIFCFLTQLFWVKNVLNKNWLIFIITLIILLIVIASGSNLERLTIIVTSYHRDYLPSNWEMDNSIYNFGFLFIAIIIKNMLLFSGLVFLTWFFSERRHKVSKL